MIRWQLTATESDLVVHALNKYANSLPNEVDANAVASLVLRLAHDLHQLAKKDRGI